MPSDEHGREFNELLSTIPTVLSYEHKRLFIF